jgi:DNA-directed RNA polymerase specialized sigma24 family protein
MPIKMNDDVELILKANDSTRDMNRFVKRLDVIILQVIKKMAIAKDDVYIEELRQKVKIHIWIKLDQISQARYPRTYLSSMIHNQIRNAMRDYGRYVDRTNQAIYYFNESQKEHEQLV